MNGTVQIICDDEHDGSSSRTLRASKSSDGVDDKSRSRVIATEEKFERNRHKTTSMVGDESSSQDDRCFMSDLQQQEQPVTPVVQGGCIDTTVVNKHDIDGCCVTNKCECSKQDSRQMSNKWLSSTFSMITSGILGKGKNAKGKDFTENVDANSNAKLVFKPEFNFFL